MKPTIYMVLLILVSVGCKSHRLLGVTPCPGAWDKDSSVVYSETYYQYKYLQEVEAGDMDPLLTQRLDSLYSFTVKVSGHEG